MKNNNFTPSPLGMAMLAALLLPITSQAASLSADQALNQFNLIVLGDAVSYSHVDGRAFVGGNLSGGDYVQHVGDTPASVYAGVTVLGNASGLNVNGLGITVLGNLSNANINSGAAMVGGDASNTNFNGPAAVGGTTSSVNFNGGQYTGQDKADFMAASATTATGTDFASLFSSTSMNVSNMTDTGGSVSIVGNLVTFNAVAVDGVAVFDLTGIDTNVFAASEFTFNMGGASTVIFNSDETNINIAANFLGGSAPSLGGTLVWNFYNAQTVDLSSQFGGSILAPQAKLTHWNNIEGSVVVGALEQHGEIHLQPFTGALVNPVPEPETYAMMLAGLALLALRRTRHA